MHLAVHFPGTSGAPYIKKEVLASVGPELVVALCHSVHEQLGQHFLCVLRVSRCAHTLRMVGPPGLTTREGCYACARWGSSDESGVSLQLGFHHKLPVCGNFFIIVHVCICIYTHTGVCIKIDPELGVHVRACAHVGTGICTHLTLVH